MKHALIIAGLMALALPASAGAQPAATAPPAVDRSMCFSDGTCVLPVPKFTPLTGPDVPTDPAALARLRAAARNYAQPSPPEPPPPPLPTPLLPPPPPPPPPPTSYVATRDPSGNLTIRASDGSTTQARMEGNQLVTPGQVQPLATFSPLPSNPSGPQVTGITRSDGVRLTSTTDSAGNTLITGSDGSVMRCSTVGPDTTCR